MSYQVPGGQSPSDPWSNQAYSSSGTPDYSAPSDPGQPVSGQPVSGEPSYGGYEPAAPPPPAGYGQQQQYGGYAQSGYETQGGYGAQPGYGAVQPYNQGQYMPRDDERQFAMLTQVLALFFGWIGALVMFLIKKDESRFARHHGAQALNLSLSVAIIAVAGIVVSFVTCGFGAFVAVPVMLVWGIAALVYHILAAVGANKGEWYVFPSWLSWPMVK